MLKALECLLLRSKTVVFCFNAHFATFSFILSYVNDLEVIF